MAHTLLTTLLLAGNAHAFWRMSCENIQIARVDPIVDYGTVAAHAHTIVGTRNIGVNASYETIVNSQCTSCEIQADKSGYWTPVLYYEHPNGTFESVPHSGAVVYYLGRGSLPDGSSTATPFPKGFMMISGNKALRSFNESDLTWGNETYPSQPVQQAIQFNCLNTIMTAASYNLTTPDPSTCADGLRVQVHYQTCWNGIDLYLEDMSHVAYLSGIDNGVCPPGYPVLLPHLFLETLYGVAQVSDNTDGGRYVLSMGDTTGYGMHADFMNGWEMDVLEYATANCLPSDDDGEIGDGLISACPALAASDQEQFTWNCPTVDSTIDEPVVGLLDKLPGCVTVTSGPEEATTADMECGANVTISKIFSTVDSMPMPTANPAIGSQYGLADQVYVGCGTDDSPGPIRTLNADTFTADNMTVRMCQAYCTSQGYRYSGVEYGTECFCDLAYDPATTFYKGINMTHGCDMLCPGSWDELCGGEFFINIYNNTDPDFVPTNDTTGSSVQLTVPLAPFPSNYEGCAIEGTTGRALNGSSYSSSDMTVAACESFCSAWTYFGLEYTDQCYCGDGLASGSYIADHGETATTSNCSYRCNGDFAEMCGGSSYLSLYLNTDYQPVYIVPSVGDYESQGCLTEGLTERALNGSALVADDMSPAVCTAYCSGLSMKYAGVEYGDQCYCGTAINTASGAAAIACDKADLMVCAGNATEYCGGSDLLNLYLDADL